MGGGSNIFVTKYDDKPSSKILMGNMWDFDTIYRTANKWATIHDLDVFYFPYLLRSDLFLNRYKSIWAKIHNVFFVDMDAYLNSLEMIETNKGINESIILDNKRWGKTFRSFEREISRARDWFSSRKNYLEREIPNL